MEVEIISKEYIKPSSPTPLHLKTHELCLLDQYHHHIYLPNYFFYPLNLSGETDDIDHILSKRLKLLKQSLSETLVHFYPVAGKMTADFSVDCNDGGVCFVEAKAKSPLNEFLEQPDLISSIHKFFPFDAKVQEDTQIAAGSDVAKIQVTSFSCGGLVISAGLSHVFGDGTTLASFMKSWAAIARKDDDDPLCPSFDASSLFPKHDSFPIELTNSRQGTRFCKTGIGALRRFVFDAEAIADLKAKAAASSCLQNPSRVEVVSAIISKCVMAAFKSKSSQHEPTLLTNLVNLRRRAGPAAALSDHLMGNIIWHGNALCTDENMELGDLACKFRETKTKLDADFVQGLQGVGGFRTFFKAITDENEMYPNVKDRITVSSWVTMGYYEIDYGWGKPIWVSIGGVVGSTSQLPTGIILMNLRSGYGIEAWVYLVEEYMAFLQVNKELLAFSTLDPCPLLGQEASPVSLRVSPG